MSQSLSQLYVHLVFSTKDRRPLLQPDIRPVLEAYLAGIFEELGSNALKIGVWLDHVHSLFSLSRTLPLSVAVGQVKTGSSAWLKRQGRTFRDFHWQAGYGAFSVSQSEVPCVAQYILNQAEHHRTVTFQEEFREFLQKYQVKYDERYVWD